MVVREDGRSREGARAFNVLAFGEQTVGTTSSQQIGVTNRSSGALSVTSVTVTADYTVGESRLIRCTILALRSRG
jgi:hypothetical protein